MMAKRHPNDGELDDMLFEKGVSTLFRSNVSLVNVVSAHEIVRVFSKFVVSCLVFTYSTSQEISACR